MAERVKIRGIYSTALSTLLVDSGCVIVDPSPEVRRRLDLKRGRAREEVVIENRDNLQGIQLVGETEKICKLLRLMQDHLLDMALLGFEGLEESEDVTRARIEFPGTSKEALDAIRLSVVPTVARHHRLCIVHPRGLEEAEKGLLGNPERKESLEKEVFEEGVLTPLKKARSVRIEHVRALGKPVRPREGVLLEADCLKLTIRRSFSKGRYDSLNMPIEEGDYGLTEVFEGAWYVKHVYYSRTGQLKGEYYNVNTPVELYPYGARYLDLEVDVVRRAGGDPVLVDRGKLAVLVEEGIIGKSLERKALEVAQSLLKDLP
jgi:hypothetical protein